jgi:MSHA pilin protein MshC
MIIVLLGILMVVAAPRFFQTGGFSVEGAAAMVAADLRHAQELAMSTHDDKDVVFTNGSTSYTAETQTDSVFKTIDLPSGVTTTTTVTFTFNPLGEPTAGGGSSVTVSKGGDAKTISVENYTGKVTIS